MGLLPRAAVWVRPPRAAASRSWMAVRSRPPGAPRRQPRPPVPAPSPTPSEGFQEPAPAKAGGSPLAGFPMVPWGQRPSVGSGAKPRLAFVFPIALRLGANSDVAGTVPSLASAPIAPPRSAVSPQMLPGAGPGGGTFCQDLDMNGVPGGIRTHGPRIRNPVLYPAELRGQVACVDAGRRRRPD